MTETHEPTQQSGPMSSLVNAGLRNASDDELIEELRDRDLSLNDALLIVHFLYPLRQWQERDYVGE